MAQAHRFTGWGLADTFVLPKGRSVIKDFDASDGDVILVPSNAEFKLTQRKNKVLIKAAGFRSVVKGVVLKELRDSIEETTPVEDFDDYKTEDVSVSETSSGRLIFEGEGSVDAPDKLYRGRKEIDIHGDVSFPSGIALDDGNTTISIHQHWANQIIGIGDIKIDGGKGNDVVQLLAGRYSNKANKGSVELSNVEVLRLGNWNNTWDLDGDFPRMSVEIYGGGIEISEETRLKKVKVVWNDIMRQHKISLKPNPDESVPFVKAKSGDIIDFNKVFTAKDEKLVFDHTGFDLDELNSITTRDESRRYMLLMGRYQNALLDHVMSKKDFDSYRYAYGNTSPYDGLGHAVIDYDNFGPRAVEQKIDNIPTTAGYPAEVIEPMDGENIIITPRFCLEKC